MDPLVRFLPSGVSLRVGPGTTVFAAARRARVSLAGACSGGALCGRCGVEVVRCDATLAPEGDAELRAKRANRIDSALRLACRLRVHDDIEVATRYG